MLTAPERSKLIEDHLELARRAAATVWPRVRQHIEFDELHALARAGLAEAAARFDPTRGVQFQTFAWYRVHGAVVDGLRRATSLPRRTWQQLVALRAAGEYLEHRSERDAGATLRGAPPVQGATALASVRSALSAIRTMYLTSLEAITNLDADADGELGHVTERIDTLRASRALRLAIERLPPRERDLVRMHYFDGKNLLEAGQVLGVSKSWASRLHAQAIDRLRRAVAPDATADPPDL